MTSIIFISTKYKKIGKEYKETNMSIKYQGSTLYIFIGVAILMLSSLVWHYLGAKKDCMLRTITTHEDAVKLFTCTVDQIDSRSRDYMIEVEKNIQDVIALANTDRTFNNTIKAIDEIAALSNFALAQGAFGAMEMLHPDKAIRDAAHQAVLKMHEFWVDSFTNNVLLYQAIKAYAQLGAPQESLTTEQNYYLTELLNDFKRGGLDLPEEQRTIVKNIKKELGSLSMEFDRNIAQDSSTIIVEKEDLAGLDQEFIASLKRTPDDKIILGTDYPTYFSVQENCSVSDTRKKLYELFQNRAYPVNQQILKNIIAQRDRLAQILGFDSYAQLDLDDQMVKTPERAGQFLDDLIEKAAPKEQEEFDQLSDELPDDVTLRKDGKIEPWDFTYVSTLYKKKHFNIDEREIAEYFPMESTIEGLLDIYQKFLSITFKHISITGAWHPDVTALEVFTQEDNQHLGYLFLDLYPRDNKYSHACEITIVPAGYDNDGSSRKSVVIVVANFPKSTTTKPSLLKRADVRTFFHEFGHAMHAMLGRTHMASVSGASVKRDFVEMPSQMLEEWLYDKDILKRVSRHYKTGEPLGDELINKMLDLKHFDSGSFLQRQCFLSKVALAYFEKGADKNPEEIMHQLHREIRPNIAHLPNTHFYASFGHLTGYGAKYYGYMWSKVFALDLFEHIKQHGLLDPVIGKKYIDQVIGRGGSADPNELLKNFLGREPRQDAFLKDLGI